jgi:hypothetical protein
VLPARLTDEELFDVEVALVTAWLQNLVVASEKHGATFRDLLSSVHVLYGDCERGLPWGAGLEIDQRTLSFGIHFGLHGNTGWYCTEFLTLVSVRAILHVMRQSGSVSCGILLDYLPLLRTSYHES